MDPGDRKREGSCTKAVGRIESKLESQGWQKIDMEMVFGNLMRFNELLDEMEFEKKEFSAQCHIIKEIVIRL